MHPISINIIWWSIGTEGVVSLTMLIMAMYFLTRRERGWTLFCLGGSALALLMGLGMLLRYANDLGL